MSNFESHLGILTQTSLSIEKLWGLKKFAPNAEQREAFLHTDGPLYITAGPGSGKTRVLLWRAVNLIVFHGIRPEEIYLSTFTEKAAHQLTEGLRDLLGLVTNYNGQPYDLAGMYIGTVHSLCRRMLTDRRRFFYDRHRYQTPTLMDALGQYLHLSRTRTWNDVTFQAGLDPVLAKLMINQCFGKESESKHRAVVNCLSIFNRFSEEIIDPEKAANLLRENPEISAYIALQGISGSDLEMLLQLYQAYQDSLQVQPNARLTDFSLLQQEAYDLLIDSQTAGQAFRHVIVDEYQDTNTIQERIFFELAKGTGNICVVGDDDQALYRFRGATVENFVEFPARCQQYLAQSPRRISLTTNYRSRQHIVDFYTSFITFTDWSKKDGNSGHHRVMDKNIRASRQDDQPAVVTTQKGKPEQVCAEIAQLVRGLIDSGKVENPNQIAFLYSSLKSVQVGRMITALENVGLRVYAPRAGSFLEVDEARAVFGLFLKIFGRPSMRGMGHELENFRDWLTDIEGLAESLVRNDPRLAQFVKDRQAELMRAAQDYRIIQNVIERNRWNPKAPYDLSSMKRTLVNAAGLSEVGKRLISSAYLDRVVQQRIEKGEPYSLEYIVRRVTSIDWNVLDLFYHLCGFEHFKCMFDAAEQQGDEGSVANLGLITQYLQRFIDDRIPLITADLLLDDQIFQRVFFSSYLFALFRLGESEFENSEDPFPKGRIPFLTIHQAKGLEFPVVVLGNLYKRDLGAGVVERIARPFLDREPGEPLERMSEFDIMRMFYVALSRAKNLLVLARFRNLSPVFKTMLNSDFPTLDTFDINSVPRAELVDDDLPRTYSFTSDYLMYKKCPRQYMIFRKFGFVPSRAQTMFFGSLVHHTLEDLHHELIRRKEQTA
ncbi:MAG: ATP-dependent helicase [Chloroflexi bacterium]|nr:ATP-dependent helicase [Chloroflexota bacterium]